MINKYAEIRDRLVLYNACKGVLRAKQAMIAPPPNMGTFAAISSNPYKSGLISSMAYNPATGGSYSQESRLNKPFNLTLQPFQQPQAPGQAQAPMSREAYFNTYGQKDVEDSWTDWIPFSGGKDARQRSANNDDYNNYVKQMQAQNRQKLNQQLSQGQQPQATGQPQPTQQVPQGVDPNTWKQFQQWQQMMAQLPSSTGNSVQTNVQKKPLGTGLGRV